MSEKSKLVGLKPSGIKPPSKRICTKTDVKEPEKAPADIIDKKMVSPVETNATSSTSSDIDKLKASEEQQRVALADVAEEGIGDAEAEMLKSSKPPSGSQRRMSITSCDTDGSRYSTDQSVVLTKDTENFIIGQRVWVGGKRAGQIAYIGETQFAAGDWAGIVLDDANGKNDGCVSGVRYFQCPPRRGVFARLTRLTLEPLADAELPQQKIRDDASSVSMSRSYQNSSYFNPYTSPNSKRTSPAPSVTSMASRSPSKTPQVGERVIVQSSQGSKVGILRFLGETRFANGMWAGVELDEPSGKNDGAVEGHRYFICPPKHGLFAPAAKVTLSPSARKAQRANSRESLLSSASRMTSPGSSRPMLPRQSLQDLLKEKQHHIEQLLKEREMERTEVDQAMLQASQAKKEYEKLKQNLVLLQEENIKLKNQLEEEARAAEDLQFNVLEQTICKEDLSTINKEQISLNKSISDKISELEKMVSDRDTIIKELRTEALSPSKALNGESKNESEIISTLKGQLEQANDLLQVLEADKMEMLRSQEDEKNRYQKEIDLMKTEHERAIKLLNTQLLESLQKITQVESTFQEQGTLSKENARLKMEFSAKQADLEEQQQNCAKLCDEIQTLKTKIQTLETALEMKSQEVIGKEKILVDNLKTELEDSKTLNKQLQNLLNDKNIEIENIKKEGLNSEDKINYLTKYADELKAELVNRDSAAEAQYINMKSIEHGLKEELDNRKADFALLKRNYDNEINTLKTELLNLEKNKQESIDTLQLKLDAELTSFKIKTDTLEKNIISLEENLNSKTLEYLQLSENFEKNISEHNKEKENLHKTISNLENSIKQLTDSIAASDIILSEKNQIISNVELERDDLMRKLKVFEEKINDLNNAKSKLENDIESLRNNTLDSNSELMKLATELKTKDQELVAVKETLNANQMSFDSSKQQQEQELCLRKEEWAKMLSQIEGKLKESEQSKLEIIQTFENEKTELKMQKDQLEEKIKVLNNQKKQIEETQIISKENNEKIIAEMLQNSNIRDSEKAKLQKQLELQQKDLNEKTEKLTKLEDNIQNYKKSYENSEKHISELEALIKSNESNKSELQNQLEKAKIEINNFKEQIKSLSANTDKATQDLMKQVNDKDVIINELQKSSEDLSNKLTVLTTNLAENKTTYEKVIKELQEKEVSFNEFKTASNLELEKYKTDLENNLKLKSNLEQELNLAQENLKSVHLDNDQLNSKIKEFNISNDNLIQCNKELTEQLKKLQELFSENKIKYDCLQDQNENMQKQLNDYAGIQNILKDKETLLLDVQNKLASSNEQLAMLTAEKETESVAKIASMGIEIDKLKKNFRAENEQLENRILELTEKLKAAEKQTTEMKDLQKHKTQNTEKQIQELLTKNSNLEKELTMLRSNQNNVHITDTAVNNNNSKSENEIFLNGQVDFLNSIIADMKHKEMELQNKVEALEGGAFNPELLNIKTKRAPAPRLYCDICEEFDQHDTEDCPRQDTDSPPKSPVRNKPPPRPYCEICEEFGHESEDCDAEETY